jgi:hypothetical protein
MEDPTEQAKEMINHHAHHAESSWISTVAVVTAIIAVLAAISGLLSNQFSNEAILEQIKASNQWSYYQSKSVKSNLLVSKTEIMEALGKGKNTKDEEKYNEYKKEQDEIKSEAEKITAASGVFFHKHEVFEKSVTLFQIAIAIAAISILTRKKLFFALSGTFGIGGVIFMAMAFMS